MVQRQGINSELKRGENVSDNVWNQTEVVQTQRRVESFVPKQTCVTYKYLGITIYSGLNFNSNFDISFRKTSGRLRLLTKLQPMLTPPAARTIYQTMVVPILTYASLSTLKLNITNERKLDKLHSRATRVIACLERLV